MEMTPEEEILKRKQALIDVLRGRSFQPADQWQDAVAGLINGYAAHLMQKGVDASQAELQKAAKEKLLGIKQGASNPKQEQQPDISQEKTLTQQQADQPSLGPVAQAAMAGQNPQQAMQNPSMETMQQPPQEVGAQAPNPTIPLPKIGGGTISATLPKDGQESSRLSDTASKEKLPEWIRSYLESDNPALMQKGVAFAHEYLTNVVPAMQKVEMEKNLEGKNKLSEIEAQNEAGIRREQAIAPMRLQEQKAEKQAERDFQEKKMREEYALRAEQANQQLEKKRGYELEDNNVSGIIPKVKYKVGSDAYSENYVPINDLYSGIGAKQVANIHQEQLKEYAAREKDMREDNSKARATLDLVKRMEPLVQNASTEWRLNPKRWWAEHVGSNPKLQEFEQIANQMALGVRIPGLGKLTDKDLEFLKAIVPQMQNTPEANMRIMKFMENSAKKQMMRSTFMRDYMNTNHNMIGADQAWEDYEESVPIVDSNGAPVKKIMTPNEYFKEKVENGMLEDRLSKIGGNR